MKALLLHEKGQWKDMKIEEVSTPTPQKGEVLVEVHAAGLNPVDYKTGTNGNPNWVYPHILGLDVAGVIAEVGEGVTEWKKGDRVVYHGDWIRPGGYAQYSITTAQTVSRIPDSVSFEDAAAIPTAGYTAYQALFRKLPLERIHTILIHGGAGGVGGFGVQLAKLAGKTVISTASAHNHEYVKSLGADYVIDYREENVKERIMEITNGRGVDAVVDAVSRQSATDSLDMLAFMGHIVYIAGAPDFAHIKPFTKVVSYHEIALAAAHQADFESQKDLAVMGDEMLALIAEGKISSLLEEIISFEEVPAALARLSERHVKGKIVAKIK
ncbi:zinc-binding dehydrogenase [Ectobacillus antri]|jgi:NADPH2:quinone reductase|uniref:Zinc-binding dehydrogenase n=1 Tax=Ectobacillus antri TaxID=2486280 RepID=A0ABT6H756_9BACI|nr:zinc-binding dehydrogenase [Ectobacillus antri]MDG4657134.1 zinc-binding dehydrogenase [Ectobacillus antri]MDG5754593.1 zinc-binding dehydrogenase [Ectobacillus antri]